MKWRPQIVHCHDWHTGLVPLLLKSADAKASRSVFTVHNAAFQGNFPLETSDDQQQGADGEIEVPANR